MKEYVMALALCALSLPAAAEWRVNPSGGVYEFGETELSNERLVGFKFFKTQSDGQLMATMGLDLTTAGNGWGLLARTKSAVSDTDNIPVTINGNLVTGYLIAGINGWMLIIKEPHEALRAFQFAEGDVDVRVDGVRFYYSGKDFTASAKKAGLL